MYPFLSFLDMAEKMREARQRWKVYVIRGNEDRQTLRPVLYVEFWSCRMQ
jgi:hypothetical protein